MIQNSGLPVDEDQGNDYEVVKSYIQKPIHLANSQS